MIVVLLQIAPGKLTAQDTGSKGLGDMPSVSFNGLSVELTPDAKKILSIVADAIRNNPASIVIVNGYAESTKRGMQLSWDRVNAVISYFLEKEGIGLHRFIFRYGQEGGNSKVVDLIDAKGEEGPSQVPPPHPQLRVRKR